MESYIKFFWPWQIITVIVVAIIAFFRWLFGKGR